MNRSHATASLSSAVRDLGEQAIDTAGAAAHDLQESARDAAAKLSEAARDEAARFGHATREAVHRAASSARDMAATVGNEASVVNDKAQRWVRDEPVKAVLIAAAFGIALTSLILLASRRH